MTVRIHRKINKRRNVIQWIALQCDRTTNRSTTVVTTTTTVVVVGGRTVGECGSASVCVHSNFLHNAFALYSRHRTSQLWPSEPVTIYRTWLYIFNTNTSSWKKVGFVLSKQGTSVCWWNFGLLIFRTTSVWFSYIIHTMAVIRFRKQTPTIQDSL